MDIKIHQPKIKGCDDSFFYDGLVAESEKAELWAVGDIRIAVDEETYRDDRARLLFKNDEELEAKVQEWIMNNWFEIIDKNGDSWSDVFYSYDEALKCLAEEIL